MGVLYANMLIKKYFEHHDRFKAMAIQDNIKERRY